MQRANADLDKARQTAIASVQAAANSAGLDELARLLQNRCSQARDGLTKLTATAEAPREERRK